MWGNESGVELTDFCKTSCVQLLVGAIIFEVVAFRVLFARPSAALNMTLGGAKEVEANHEFTICYVNALQQPTSQCEVTENVSEGQTEACVSTCNNLLKGVGGDEQANMTTTKAGQRFVAVIFGHG